MNNNDDIKKIVELYVEWGNIIVNHSTQLKKKLELEELDSDDLESLHEQMNIGLSSLSMSLDTLEKIMKNRKNSI